MGITQTGGEITMERQKLISYIGLVLLGFVIIFTMAIYAINNINAWNTTMTNKISNNTVDAKKDLLKSHVQRTINEINIEKQEVIKELHSEAELLNIKLEISLEQIDIINEKCLKDLQRLSNTYENINYTLYDKQSNQITFSSENLKIFHLNYIKESVVYAESTAKSRYNIYTYSTMEDVDNVVKDRMTALIRNLRVKESSYLWINEIVNYNGGDNYALRLVYPQFPELEGTFISTETRDKTGNKPYLDELNGLKDHGEIFFNQYIDSREGDQIDEKLIYSKLYEPYNWIIATGIYLNDLNALIEKDYEQQQYFNLIQILLAIFAVVLTLLTLIIWRLIHVFNNTLLEENRVLEDTKRVAEDRLQAMSEIAYCDPLTGLYNRRAMLLRLTEELSSTSRHQYYSSVILCDIDYFKNINDSYGHDVGDEVLKRIAVFFKDHLRADDSISRWGGDEFLILLNHTSGEDAHIVAESLRLMVHEYDLSDLFSDTSFSMSFGVTDFQKDDACEDVIKRADLALYDSKRSGRNKATVYYANT